MSHVFDRTDYTGRCFSDLNVTRIAWASLEAPNFLPHSGGAIDPAALRWKSSSSSQASETYSMFPNLQPKTNVNRSGLGVLQVSVLQMIMQIGHWSERYPGILTTLFPCNVETPSKRVPGRHDSYLTEQGPHDKII